MSCNTDIDMWDKETEELEIFLNKYFPEGELDEEERLKDYLHEYQNEKKKFCLLSTPDHICNRFDNTGSTLYDRSDKYENATRVGKFINLFLHKKSLCIDTIIEIGAGTGANTKHIVSQITYHSVKTYITTDAFHKSILPIRHPKNDAPKESDISYINDFRVGLPKPTSYKMKMEQELCIARRKEAYDEKLKKHVHVHIHDNVIYTDIILKSAQLDIFKVFTQITTDDTIQNACILICCPPPIEQCEISLDTISLIESINIKKVKLIIIVRFNERYSYLDGTYEFKKHTEILSKYYKLSKYVQNATIHNQNIQIYRSIYFYERTENF